MKDFGDKEGSWGQRHGGWGGAVVWRCGTELETCRSCVFCDGDDDGGDFGGHDDDVMMLCAMTSKFFASMLDQLQPIYLPCNNRGLNGPRTLHGRDRIISSLVDSTAGQIF